MIQSMRGLWLGMKVMWMDSGLDCFYTKKPRFSIASASLQQLKDLQRKDTIVASGSASSSNYGSLFKQATNLATDWSMSLALFLNPSTPKSKSDPQAALKHPPFLVPIAVGEMYIPPGQVENEKYWCFLIAEELQIRADDPLGANPYLWRSALMLVTPSTRKSHGPNLWFPSISMKGRMNPPMAESTCSGTPYCLQISAISTTLSTTPCGY